MEKSISDTECMTVDVKTCAQMLGLGLRSTYRIAKKSILAFVYGTAEGDFNGNDHVETA